MSEIKSKPYVPVEGEAEWPPRFGNRKSGHSYYDREKKCMVEGYPVQEEKYGKAPMTIMDSMPKTYHEGARCEVESRSEWARLDKEHNKLTFGSLEEARRHTAKGREEERKAIIADRRQARVKATQAYKENKKAVQEKLRHEGDKQVAELKKTGVLKELTKIGMKIHD